MGAYIHQAGSSLLALPFLTVYNFLALSFRRYGPARKLCSFSFSKNYLFILNDRILHLLQRSKRGPVKKLWIKKTYFLKLLQCKEWNVLDLIYYLVSKLMLLPCCGPTSLALFFLPILFGKRGIFTLTVSILSPLIFIAMLLISDYLVVTCLLLCLLLLRLSKTPVNLPLSL